MPRHPLATQQKGSELESMKPSSSSRYMEQEGILELSARIDLFVTQIDRVMQRNKWGSVPHSLAKYKRHLLRVLREKRDQSRSSSSQESYDNLIDRITPHKSKHKRWGASRIKMSH